MAGRFIRITQVQVIQNSPVLNVDILFIEGLFQLSQRIIRDRLVYHYNSIVQVSALDQVIVQQVFQFM